MRNLKNNKSAETDGIHSELIKYRGIKQLNRMCKVVRQIWVAEEIPEERKKKSNNSCIERKEIEISVRITEE